MPTLVPELDPMRLQQMAIVTSHAVARFKVMFCADKVDRMLVQTLRLWDKLQKTLINYSTKLHEWFGFHFPEMEQIVPDKLAYAQVIKLMGIPLRQKGESNSRLISKHGFFKRII
jgi:RNA processing factor Prp31